jgi:cell division septation protein DedD
VRALFLVLVLANLGFFAWARWIDAAPDTGAKVALSHANQRAPTLRLATEMASSALSDRALPTAPRQGDQPAPEEATAAFDTAGGCVSLGPFRGLTDATQALAALRAAGFPARQRLEEGEIWVGYWVSLPAAPSRDRAEATIAMLAERGITDTYILPGEDEPNRISLGVFTDRRRAERRRDEVALLGLDATISDRRQPGSVYWLDVELGDSTQPPGTDLLQTEPGRILRIETRPCRSAAAEVSPPAESIVPATRRARDNVEPPGPVDAPRPGPPDALSAQPTNPT